jgi:UDP-N-acetylglucosamine 2-epimerase (non-hydrolysing)
LLIFVFGTTAEAIKIAPLLLELEKRATPFILLSTGQQGDLACKTIEEFGVRGVCQNLGKHTEPIKSIFEALKWFCKTLFRALLLEKRKDYLIHAVNHQIVVHGDTLSTFIGAAMGLRYRVRIIHIEAGLRSNNLMHPFPEEIVRRFVSRFSNLNFAPSKLALDNLESSPGLAINTFGNTSFDALKLLRKSVDRTEENLSCLVLLHRTELLRNRNVFTQTLSEIVEISKSHQVIFVRDHASKNFGDLSLDDFPNIQVLGKLDYFSFHKLLNSVNFVITDSGGLQEECALLGVPCLIHRLATEREDGVGLNARLSFWKKDSLIEFASVYPEYKHSRREMGASPVQIILKELTNQGII